MTTNKLDELIEDYTIELRNSIGSLLPTPHPDDFKQAIEAYIAEREIKLHQSYYYPIILSKSGVDPMWLSGYNQAMQDCEAMRNERLDQLKSNERS